MKGDVDGDGKVTSHDAMLTLQLITGLWIGLDYNKWAADMNGDGRIRANDAILMLRKAAGLDAPSIDFASASRPITITLAETHGLEGESITVPLKVDNIAGLAGGDISIVYDSAVLRAVNVLSDSNVLLASNVAEPGMVRITFASVGSLNSETVAEIQFDILADDVSPLKLQKVEL